MISIKTIEKDDDRGRPGALKNLMRTLHKLSNIESLRIKVHHHVHKSVNFNQYLELYWQSEVTYSESLTKMVKTSLQSS